jgi:2-oxoglutarate dehydrogenase E1 component
MSAFVAPNLDYIEEQYAAWKADPDRVGPDWRFFFEGFELGISGRRQPPGEGDGVLMLRQARVHALVHRYRELGHLLACLDPLEACPTEHPLLSLDALELSLEDLERRFVVPDAAPPVKAPLKEILAGFRETYCRSIGVEFMHLQDPRSAAGSSTAWSPCATGRRSTPPARRRILEKLVQSSVFERFLNTKYVGVTRFSLEGGDALIPGLDFLFERAAALGAGKSSWAWPTGGG